MANINQFFMKVIVRVNKALDIIFIKSTLNLYIIFTHAVLPCSYVTKTQSTKKRTLNEM